MHTQNGIDTPTHSLGALHLHPSAIIIANPTSGGFLPYTRNLEETLEVLRQQGWQVDLHLTTAPGHAQQLAHQAVARQTDLVIAVGGDGTINELIQELAGSETALGVLPNGTVNLWAREMGIPFDTAKARDILLHGQIRHVDLGRCNERYFLLMAGIGIDGEVTHAVEKKPLKRLGVLGYLLITALLGLRYPSFKAYLHINGRTVKVRALQIIIGNTQLYAGAIKFTWEAKCDDGLLDVCVVRKRSILGRLIVALDFLLGHKNRQRWVRYEKATSVEVRTRKPIAVQIDGDPAGHTPTTFTISPGALKVLVPQTVSKELFSS